MITANTMHVNSCKHNVSKHPNSTEAVNFKQIPYAVSCNSAHFSDKVPHYQAEG